MKTLFQHFIDESIVSKFKKYILVIEMFVPWKQIVLSQDVAVYPMVHPP